MTDHTIDDTNVVLNNDGVARAGSGVLINSSEDEDEEQYNIRKSL